MALDNFASAYLRMGLYDNASSMLYPVLNHASRFVTYCEERGTEVGSTVKTGDMQHLWTPLSVCSYILDAVCFSDDETLHLCSGLPVELMEDGKEITVKNLATEYGKLSLKLKNTGGYISWSVHFDRAERLDKAIHLHLRTPNASCEVPVVLKNGVAHGMVNCS